MKIIIFNHIDDLMCLYLCWTKIGQNKMLSSMPAYNLNNVFDFFPLWTISSIVSNYTKELLI